MSMQVRVAALRQKLEQLFPGKWLTNGGKSQRHVQTGIAEIDNSVTGGVARKRITEWTGPLSSGKTSILRSAVSYWCSRGLNVAYIDTEGKLYPADWAFVEQQWKRVGETVKIGPGKKNFNREGADHKRSQRDTSAVNRSAATCEKEERKVVIDNTDRPLNYAQPPASGARTTDTLSERGKFWIVRPPEVNNTKDEDQAIPLVSKKHLQVQEAVWSADQFIRSNAFDVVILDLGGIDLNNRKSRGMGYCPSPWRIYARLQRALERSKAALIMVSDLADMHGAGHAEFLPETENSKSNHSNNSKNSITKKTSSSDNSRDPNNSSTSSTSNISSSSISNNWGCHARFSFNRGTKIQGHPGLNGLTLIVPIVRFKAWRDGMSQELEVSLASSVPNRLFTHPQIPDRRSSKG